MRLNAAADGRLRKEVQALRHDSKARRRHGCAPSATAPCCGRTATPSGRDRERATRSDGGMPPPAPKKMQEIFWTAVREVPEGFYGTLERSRSRSTKGINGLTRTNYSLADPQPNSGYVQGA